MSDPTAGLLQVGLLIAGWTAARRRRGPRLPTADESLDRLARLIENLLDMSRLQAGALSVELRVIDRGLGVPPDERDRVFAPFQRLGDTDNTTGVGLGLALARPHVGREGKDAP
jgi:K+-sensing histidine kinase KdpD